MQSKDDPEQGLSDVQAAELLGISRALFRKLEKTDARLQQCSVKWGGRRTYIRGQIIAYRALLQAKQHGQSRCEAAS